MLIDTDIKLSRQLELLSSIQLSNELGGVTKKDLDPTKQTFL